MLRTADGQQDAARRAQRRPASRAARRSRIGCGALGAAVRGARDAAARWRLLSSTIDRCAETRRGAASGGDDDSSSGAGSREERPGLLQARADGARRGALSGGGVRHMLLQDLLLGDLGCASEWASVGRPAGAHRDAGPAARNASTQRFRRHSCRLSSSVTVRGTNPLLGVCANACLLAVYLGCLGC